MAIVFPGKRLAASKIRLLKKEVDNLKKEGIVLRFLTFVFEKEDLAMRYLMIKKKVAKRLGISMKVKVIKEDDFENAKREILNSLKKSKDDGFMIQLPFPVNFSQKEKDEIINLIPNDKDVDGMRKDSLFVTPVVKAVLTALSFGLSASKKRKPLILVLGGKGFVGEKLVNFLRKEGYEVFPMDKDGFQKRKVLKSDVIISATGVSKVVKGEMIKEGSILVDLGFPKPEFDDSCLLKSIFYTPVPGGVGPLTVAYLFENLIWSAKKRLEKKS